MDAARLAQFYRSVSSWPKFKGELAVAAERVSDLLGVPLVAIYLTEEEELIACHLRSGAGGGRPLELQLVEEVIRSQIRRFGEGDADFRQISLTTDGSPLGSLLPDHVLTMVRIPRPSVAGESRPAAGASCGSQHGSWVVTACSGQLGQGTVVLQVAAAQKLAELAAISRLDGVIKVRSQFLSIASHELKTPLTSIYGILQLQQRMARMRKDEPASPSPEEEERKRSFLKIMIRQVERLTELIDGLLDVSRIQNGRFQVEPAEVDVASVVRETVGARLTVIAQENGATLQLDLPEHLQACVDPVRIEEVVTNLVMNGIRFSPEGGVVAVRLRDEGAGAFRLTVRDQGPSVPVEDRERIFQPFERAQRTSRLGGLGLGLFISRQIAQLHGGNVTLIESVPGKGNVFEAYFPGTIPRQMGLASA